MAHDLLSGRLLTRSQLFRRPCATIRRRYSSTSVADPPVRTRFAPSPTGFLHIGSLRTALFNYLFAKHTGGKFLLRIEDTDQKRTVKGSEESICETLRWAGLLWDEGPGVGGPFGPYRQSERSSIYKHWASHLLSSGHAYRCFCTQARLDALAALRKSTGITMGYDRTCYRLSSSESSSRAGSGEPFVIRLISPDVYPIFHDLVCGIVKWGENTRIHALNAFEDPILLKSDGLPTYHLANVVDDHLMEVSHVIRATEWLPSTPKHVHLYNCFGWSPPKFAHVGLLQDQARHKLSKRHGDAFVGEYRAKGYLPESLVNFVALLGWHHHTESDVLTLAQLVEKFDLENLTSGNTVVNLEKLDFLQKRHVRTAYESDERKKELLTAVEEEVRKQLSDSLETMEPIKSEYIAHVLEANIHNYVTPETFVTSSAYFFEPPAPVLPPRIVHQVKNYLVESQTDSAKVLEPVRIEIEATEKEWTTERWKALLDFDERTESRPNWQCRMRLLRLALAGGEIGPGMADTMALLGRERTKKRIEEIGKKLGI